MASTAAASSNAPMDLVKDTYIPIFSNRPSDYREWRQRIVLYRKKLELQKESKEERINLMTSLTGTSWRQIEHLAEKAAEIRLTGQGGGCDVMRADGCDESTFELRGEGQFSITPSPGSTMEEFLYFGQWKARKE